MVLFFVFFEHIMVLVSTAAYPYEAKKPSSTVNSKLLFFINTKLDVQGL